MDIRNNEYFRFRWSHLSRFHKVAVRTYNALMAFLPALDTFLGPLENATKADVVAAMKGHVVAFGQLVGTYEKVKK